MTRFGKERSNAAFLLFVRAYQIAHQLFDIVICFAVIFSQRTANRQQFVAVFRVENTVDVLHRYNHAAVFRHVGNLFVDNVGDVFQIDSVGGTDTILHHAHVFQAHIPHDAVKALVNKVLVGMDREVVIDDRLFKTV